MVNTSCGATGDDVVFLDHHQNNIGSTFVQSATLQKSQKCKENHKAETHVVSQLGMIRQAYNPRSNIFYAEEFCLFEQIVSYL